MRWSIFTLFTFSVFFFSSNCSNAQNKYQARIKGKIINKSNGKPVSYATIRIPKRNVGMLADISGAFSLSLQQANKNDTFLISSIGYNTLKIPVENALDQTNFYLTEFSKDLENVVVKSYTNEATEGAKSEVAGYFKSWSIKNFGGEIGKIFYIKQSDYKIERVRFKVNNQCDSCNVRIRIRALHNGLPDRELFSDSISTTVKRLSFDDKSSEFDLTARNIILKEKGIFVSFELLKCYTRNTDCSFCFIGTEPGNYLFRRWTFADWQESTENSIYLRLYYKY